jgi:hypothetical protein
LSDTQDRLRVPPRGGDSATSERTGQRRQRAIPVPALWAVAYRPQTAEARPVEGAASEAGDVVTWRERYRWTRGFIHDFGWVDYIAVCWIDVFRYRLSNWRCWFGHDLKISHTYEEFYDYESWMECEREKCEFCRLATDDEIQADFAQRHR